MDVALRFRIPSSKIVNDIVDGEVIILKLDTGTYYSLDSRFEAEYSQCTQLSSTLLGIRTIMAHARPYHALRDKTGNWRPNEARGARS